MIAPVNNVIDTNKRLKIWKAVKEIINLHFDDKVIKEDELEATMEHCLKYVNKFIELQKEKIKCINNSIAELNYYEWEFNFHGLKLTLKFDYSEEDNGKA